MKLRRQGSTNGLQDSSLIGRRIEVVSSKNKSHIGVEGEIIDETKNSLVIECKGRRKRLLKSGIMFMLNNNGKVVVDGKSIKKRPEDR
jgi:ribonuclease P protein subunit POP4